MDNVRHMSGCGICYKDVKKVCIFGKSTNIAYQEQRWKPVGSKFFDRPVKPVEKPVEFSFLATKRHLSTNRNVLIYFIINKTFYKNQY